VHGIDHFGNVRLEMKHEELTGGGRPGRHMPVEVCGSTLEATYARTFVNVAQGDLVLYDDAYRTLTLVLERGCSAATALGVGRVAELPIRPPK
jgi:S-adenosylmethionine hydrolase